MLDTHTRPPIILVVEDDSSQRELIDLVLTNSDMVVIPVEDGTSALHWLAQNKADLMVLDFMLPDISGIDLCQQIRRHCSPTSLPMLTLSFTHMSQAANSRQILIHAK
jgi:DNA-binding response OmpR family regulator